MVEKSSRILDIGIGFGGAYLAHEQDQRIGLDHPQPPYSDGLRFIKRIYPHIPIVYADAQFLPFRDTIFDEIQIYFPHGILLDIGLHYGYLTSSNWYAEFARALTPEGKLTIWGDQYVDPEIVSTGSCDFFDMQILPLSIEELRSIGTQTSQYLAENIKKSRYRAKAIKIELVRKN